MTGNLKYIRCRRTKYTKTRDSNRGGGPCAEVNGNLWGCGTLNGSWSWTYVYSLGCAVFIFIFYFHIFYMFIFVISGYMPLMTFSYNLHWLIYKFLSLGPAIRCKTPLYKLKKFCSFFIDFMTLFTLGKYWAKPLWHSEYETWQLKVWHVRHE